VTPLEDAVSDAIVAMCERGQLTASRTIDVHYTEAEWELVERFHRFIPETRTFSPDRYPFLRLRVLGNDVRLMPYNPQTTPETIQ
jgi:autonomous glycyl radical cofactor GrcA